MPALRRACEFLEIDAGFAFRDLGSRNGSDRYRSMLLARHLERRGLPVPGADPKGHERFAAYLERCAEASVGAGGPGAAEIQRELRALFEPSTAQADEIRERLAPDLARFADRFGIDVWEEPAAAPAERAPAAAWMG